MRFDLENMSPRELGALIASAEKQQKMLLKRRPIVEVRAELTALIASYGYTVAEVVGHRSGSQPARSRVKRRKLGKAAVKYRDPEYRRNTWTGRGSMPRWLAEKVKRGMRAADFLIPGLARPTAKRVLQVGQRTVFKQATGSG